MQERDDYTTHFEMHQNAEQQKHVDVWTCRNCKATFGIAAAPSSGAKLLLLDHILGHVPGLRASVALLALVCSLFVSACSDGGGSHDAGDVSDYEPPIVGLFDAGDAGGELEPDAEDLADAGELEPDAEDLADAGELEPDAEDLADAGELEPDAGELAACSEDSDRRVCRAAACSSLCRVAFSLQCCDGTAGELELCACEKVSP